MASPDCLDENMESQMNLSVWKETCSPQDQMRKNINRLPNSKRDCRLFEGVFMIYSDAYYVAV